jgi:putative transcriptional regulator
MTPHHHLEAATLISYSSGTLPMALAMVAAAHLERCASCRAQLLDADRIGGVLLMQQRVDPPSESARAAMLRRLDAQSLDPTPARPSTPDLVQAPDPDLLPQALHRWFGRSMRRLNWKRVAPGVQRIRAEGVSGGNLMLLRIAPGSKLPLHTHGGSELTLILQGAYDDVLGHFGPGDIADLDGEVQHQPVTSAGVPCVCVAATDAPLKFAGWFARMVQPLVGF